MTPAAAAAVPANTAVGEKQPGDHSLFDGQWDCNDVVITLYSDFTAHKSAPRNPLGTWEYVDGEARIAWNDGKRTVLRRDGEGFRKLTWMAGANPDSPPDNSFPAVKKGDTATETAAPPEMAAKETAAPAAAAVSAPRSTATEQKFVRLFNGRNLSGWHLRDVSGPRCWSVRKGELICVARQKKMDLISDRLFRDFELQLDFKLGPGGDSGVFLRGRYQVQLFDTTKKMAPPKSACGAIQGQIAPLRQAYFGPGRWNTLAVTLVGRQVTVVMNGQVVIDAQQISGPTVDALDDLEDQPGPILLQCWLNEFAFRNIRIRPIQ
jgi:hypothetical protein